VSTSSTTQTWITGAEYQAERRRLLDLGYGSDSPEYRALARRVDERNDYLWETYGVPLLTKYPGKWIAISPEGEVILADREVDILRLARERFGAGTSCIARLDESRGAHRIGPRASC
jgi:hypothetical protein